MEGISALDERFNDSMNFPWAQPHAIFAPETSSWCPTIYDNGSVMPIDHEPPTHNFSSFRQNNVFSQSQNALSVLDQPFNKQRTAQIWTRKRAPKAPTMSAKDWKPHKNRVRQLYVSEGKSIEELREIMNKELGITATLRQYKVQIQKMKLEKNVKAKERKAVVKHFQHRSYAMGKKSSHVRIRGHKINHEKLFRWAKENLVDQPSMSANPPSPLPSCISIYTNSVCERLEQASPVVLKHQRLVNGSAIASNINSTLIQRLLKYAQGPKYIIESQEARAVFNDLQLILRNEYISGKTSNEDHWNPSIKEDIIHVRNLMNLTQALRTSKLALVNEIRDQDIDFSKITNKHAAWLTPYGRVQASFWAVSNDSNLKNQGDATRTTKKTVAARLTIVPSSIRTSPFRVVVDFTPHIDPSATITYQAMIPNGSEVFKIASFGGVKELIKLLEKGLASLTDHDEEGRSLLNYAITHMNIDMCDFLAHKKADINAIEPCYHGYIGPVHCVRVYLDGDMEEIERHQRARCDQIMLEAGADFSLEADYGNGLWWNAFACAIQGSSLATLKHILDFGEPFISLSGTYRNFWGKSSVLTILAHICGYNFGNTIDVVDKAILLLNRKADISCRDENGDTVLHILFKCERWHESISRIKARGLGVLQFWDLSFKTPKDLLMVFITAGADVYAANYDGETPSMVAFAYGREDEWIQALELCGYEPGEVLKSCIHHPTHEHQTSKLSFQEYCQQRQQRQQSGRFEDIQSDDIDDDSRHYDEDASEKDKHEETRIITDIADCVDGCGGNMEIFGGAECADYGMEIGLDNEGEKDTYNAEEMVDRQGLGLDDMMDNSIEGTDVNLDDWLDNGMDFMQSFNDFGMFLDAPF